MRFKIWGSRGSTPISGSEFARYGGETACVEVLTNTGETILLDAGTGLTAFTRAHKPQNGNDTPPVICLSHLHLDHIQGLPFYPPLYSAPLTIYGPRPADSSTLAENLAHLFDGVIFPVLWQDLPSVRAIGLEPNASFRVGSALVEVCPTNHPGQCLAWKITADGETLIYTGDHEIPLNGSSPQARQIHNQLLEFMANADVAIVDGHYSEADHKAHAGWGHSHFNQWAGQLRSKKITNLIFTHFSPTYTDREIDRLLQEARKIAPEMEMTAAYQGMELDIDTCEKSAPPPECRICDFFQHLSRLSDTHAILDAILSESRKLTGAEAGTVYLRENDDLVFAAAQNDKLFPASQANKYTYMTSRLPVDRTSIAGFTASTGNPLNIPDVYAMDPENEFGFNDAFDRITGYRTRSILALPLLNAKNHVMGVLQLINPLSHGQYGIFDESAVQASMRMAHMATIPLEKSFLIVNMIMRMLQTSALRDPKETSSHVRRVGSVAAELYQRWAEARQIDPEEIQATKSKLRLAAMLHDIGKVGIPDGVLKKPGRLDVQERAIMETHAALGASLFEGDQDDIEKMAREIALHHHAKWDGSGYTGSDSIPSPAGEEIPLWARIVSIADVYDALVSRRCYKDAWQPEDALAILRKDAGSHFDPELVEHFIAIQDVIKTIYEKYSDYAD